MLIEDKNKSSLEALDQKLEYDIYIWGHERCHYIQKLYRNILFFTSFIDFFAQTPMLLFWFFRD